jgi:hypothetical protein
VIDASAVQLMLVVLTGGWIAKSGKHVSDGRESLNAADRTSPAKH